MELTRFEWSKAILDKLNFSIDDEDAPEYQAFNSFWEAGLAYFLKLDPVLFGTNLHQSGFVLQLEGESPIDND
jgi:hypothetical protein